MVLGIIAEYNPFHNGHLYHILKSKELTKDDYVIVLIGGNFTQRGESSIVDKWTKAEMALAGGADLVIELPTLYSVSSAENFADGAVKILNSLKIVDHLSFGAECQELNKLNIIANILYEEPKEFKAFLADELSKGVSFPKARENAILSYLKDFSYKNILSEPNNILGIEYLKALKKYRSRIKPVLVPRKSSGHLSLDYTGSISSSTSIRNMLKTSNTTNLKDALTPGSYTILKEEINKGHFVKDFSKYEKIALYNLRLMSLEEIKKLPDVSEGLENLIKKAALSCNTVDDFVNIVCSKRYTKTRIRRILLYALLEISKKDIAISKKVVPYFRVLGFNDKGKNLVSKIKHKNPSAKIVTSVKKFVDSNGNKNLQVLMNKDIWATNVYTLGFESDSWGNLDFSRKIVVK